MDARLLLTVQEAGQRLSVKRSFMYRLIQTGKIKSVKVGGARRIAVADLEEFVSRLSATEDLSDE